MPNLEHDWRQNQKQNLEWSLEETRRWHAVWRRNWI
jgi:hypothetical protein